MASTKVAISRSTEGSDSGFADNHHSQTNIRNTVTGSSIELLLPVVSYRICNTSTDGLIQQAHLSIDNPAGMERTRAALKYLEILPARLGGRRIRGAPRIPKIPNKVASLIFEYSKLAM